MTSEESYEDIYDYVVARVGRREYWDGDRKTYDDVFDRRTLLAVYKLMTTGYIEHLEFPISIGKEANVFRAIAGENISAKYVAVKIYRVNIKSFKNMHPYIDGDPDFQV